MSTIPTGWQAFDEGRRRGLCMIPGIPGQKKALIKWKEYQERKPTDEEVEGWRAEYRSVNPIVVCGPVSGLMVLDCDGTEAAKLLGELGGVPRCAQVQTPRGAGHVHYWLNYPRELGRIQNFAGGYYDDLPGLDLRAAGGVAIYPGAAGASLKLYRWVAGHALGEAPIASLPEDHWLYRYIKEHNDARNLEEQEPPERRRVTGATTPYGAAALTNLLTRLGAASGGGRNDALNKAAFLVGQLVGGYEVERAQAEYGLEYTASQIGLDRDANCGKEGVRSTIKSGMEAGMRRPRYAPPAKGAIPAAPEPEPPVEAAGRVEGEHDCRYRRENERLRRQLGLMQLEIGALRNPDLRQIAPTLIELYKEVDRQKHDGLMDEQGYVPVSLWRVANRAGVSQSTAADHIKKGAERGLVDKRTVQIRLDEPIADKNGELRHVQSQSIVRSEGDVLDRLTNLTRYEAQQQHRSKWGGKRPRCSEHPNAPVIKRTEYECTECHQIIRVDTTIMDDCDDDPGAGD